MMNQMASMVGPISHLGHGMHSGMSMENGMGMIRGGPALSEDFGPALGRDIGESAKRETATSHLAGPVAQLHSVSDNQGSSHHEGHAIVTQGGIVYPIDDPVKKQVPGYPQDMWMSMEEWVPQRPEFHGLRPTWDRAMMGMMTLVRVLPQNLYDHIMELKRQEGSRKDAAGSKPNHEHQHSPN